MNKTKKLVLLSLFVAISVIISYFENLLPPLSIIAPGAKLGLSNIVSLSALYIFSYSQTILILVMRIVIVSILFGNMQSMVYSLVGGLLSIIAMIIIKSMKRKDVSIVGISMTGAFFFNVGQLMVAAIIIKNIKIFYYLPWISLISIATGIFVGLVSHFVVINKHIVSLNQEM